MLDLISPEIKEIANELREAEAKGQPIDPIRARLADASAAYSVQEVNTLHRLQSGGRLVGRKIGLTNPVVQRQLGVDQPDYGMLFADMDIPHGGTLPYCEGAQLKVEAEIAFVLGRDLHDPQASSAEILRAVEYVLPSIEVVGSRIANWDIGFLDTVADNASSAFFTLGASARKLDAVDLLGCKMRMTDHNGTVLSEGLGRACLGSPLNALGWLARRMATLGRPLREGDVVLSGALGPMVTAARATTYKVMIEGIGESEIGFDL